MLPWIKEALDLLGKSLVVSVRAGRVSVILGEQVRVLDKRRLLRRRGDLAPATMARLNEALRIAFDLD
jgi:mRNA-degrading endonuclease toxin of MazEF toxin-antitoxin module